MTQLPINGLTDQFRNSEQLDNSVEKLRSLADRLVSDRRVDDALTGKWLGHAVHPALTDLPIGFWTSAFVLDFTGRRTRGAADLLVALGLVSALPTMAAGLADWRHLDRGGQRVGAVHAASNGVAFVLYGLSLGHRAKGHRVRGVLIGLAGAAAASAGGFLGGHLAFGNATDAGAEPQRPGSPASDAEPSEEVDQQDAAFVSMGANGN